MSMIASFYQVERARLDEAVAAGAGAVEDFLAEQDEIPDAFNWSGYVMLFAMHHLAEAHGVPVTDASLDGDSTYVFGLEHQHLVPLLNPDRFERAQLRNALRSLSLDFEEAGMAAIDAITALRDQLAALTSDRALVVSVS